jgi:CubicO group peptidase (beta-lactamase class C family)
MEGMRRALVTIGFLLCGCAHAAGPPALNPDEARHLAAIERSLVPSDSAGAPPQPIEARLQHWHVPGVSVAVFGDGRIRWAKAWGTSDAVTRRPVTTRTRFQAGSISKPVTAVAVLQLVDDNRLDLEGDANVALRSWKVPHHAWSAVSSVTPAGLISHTAGISVRSFPGYAADAAIPTINQVLDGSPPANTAPIRVVARPGAAYSYSGGGYVILQRALMDLDGLAFEALMRKRVLNPLGMTASSFSILRADGRSEIASGHTAAGQRVQGGSHIYPESAAAGLWSTPSDLARFAMAIQAALSAQDNHRSIVSRRSARWMISQNGTPTQGMAFDLSPSSFYHAGDTEGYYAAAVGGKDGHMGIAIMTNGAQGGHLMNEIIEAVAKEYSWED